MKTLNYQLRQLCKYNKDGSFSTQAMRIRILDLMAQQLNDLGFRKMQAQSLKPKHVVALTKLWQQQGLSIGTRKNRLSILRWWAAKVNKESVVARENAHYGLARRQYVTNASRVTHLNKDQLDRINDPYTRLSLRLQQAFGLRREEAIKFRPSYAIKGDHLLLKSSWCKGGRPRMVPITNDEQRQLLIEVSAFARGGALIPADLNYVQQLHRYEGQTRRAGLRKLHGLRHGYAQRRFSELTRFACPANGGPLTKELTPEQRARQKCARLDFGRTGPHARKYHCGVSRPVTAGSQRPHIAPRLLRFRDAPFYVGMDRNRFNREVRPFLTSIPIGRQGLAFDRLELDAWVEEYKSRNGRPAANRRKLWDAKKYQDSSIEAGSGTSTRESEVAEFAKALESITSKEQRSI